MKSPPNIVVQLVHIQGALKGEIQEFSDPIIFIGRDPSYHVHFPKDQTAISRKHAEIIREGNRFKLLDKSTNGTLVNGKKVSEAYLKDGDVLTFSDGGPKVSFLTKVDEGPPEIQQPPQHGIIARKQSAPPPTPSREQPSQKQPPTPAGKPPPFRQPQAEPHPIYKQGPPVQKTQVPLIIQYGPTLRSFKELPITIGKAPGCDFTLDNPVILDKHAQIFFAQDQYHIKDLTGKNMLSVNGRPIEFESPICSDDILALSPQGPRFRFLGGGRLMEIEEPEQDVPPLHEMEKGSAPKARKALGNIGAKALFQKFLRR